MKKHFLAALLAASIAMPASLAAFDLGSAMENVKTEQAGEPAKSNALIDTLVSTLGVSSAQASGGVAALLAKAKNAMSGTDFSALLSAVPDLASLSGGAGKLLGSAGGLSLGEQFSALGMNGDMVGKFIPVVLDYVKSVGGNDAMQLLKSALGA